MPQLRRESGKGAKLRGKVKVGSSSEVAARYPFGPNTQQMALDRSISVRLPSAGRQKRFSGESTSMVGSLPHREKVRTACQRGIDYISQ